MICSSKCYADNISIRCTGLAHIKTMICRGFKSFRNKTVIQFDKGFTAIVGANGSGKSNIIDAFCFVLGELSAKTLRANNTKDLISNGGDGYAPAKSAYVEIIFDNSERTIPSNSDLLSISREVDGSGQSDYRLNGKRSSRKEIQELWTGWNATQFYEHDHARQTFPVNQHEQHPTPGTAGGYLGHCFIQKRETTLKD